MLPTSSDHQTYNSIKTLLYNSPNITNLKFYSSSEASKPEMRFLMVTRILDWLAMSRSGVVDNSGSPVLRAFASIRRVCHSASLKIITSPRRSSLSRVILSDPACQTGVRLWIRIRESWMDAVKSLAWKLMMTELMETNIPSMICSAKPYLPPVLHAHTHTNVVRSTQPSIPPG